MAAPPEVFEFRPPDADAVLAALGVGILQSAGKPYRLSDVAQAHADLQEGRSSGSLYLVP